MPALFEVGHDAAENNPNHDRNAYDNEKLHGDLGALWRGPGKRIEVYNHVMAVGHQQGYRGEREQNQKKKFDKSLHLLPPMNSRALTARF